MIFITILTGVYKPTYNWGGHIEAIWVQNMEDLTKRHGDFMGFARIISERPKNCWAETERPRHRGQITKDRWKSILEAFSHGHFESPAWKILRLRSTHAARGNNGNCWRGWMISFVPKALQLAVRWEGAAAAGPAVRVNAMAKISVLWPFRSSDCKPVLRIWRDCRAFVHWRWRLPLRLPLPF